MGKFIEQQDKQKDLKERNKVRRETLGKFFYDLAKLSFAGLVIGWITPMSDNTDMGYNIIVMLSGVAFAFIFGIIGNEILK